jgi:hypothetical protein
VKISKGWNVQWRQGGRSKVGRAWPVEKARYTTLVQLAWYLQGIWRYHNRNIRERSFSIGDLVLRRIQDESGLHKLNSRWEGPFVVKQIIRSGSYRLQYPEGQDFPNSWNVQNLRKFYP